MYRLPLLTDVWTHNKHIDIDWVSPDYSSNIINQDEQGPGFYNIGSNINSCYLTVEQWNFEKASFLSFLLGGGGLFFELTQQENSL